MQLNIAVPIVPKACMGKGRGGEEGKPPLPSPSGRYQYLHTCSETHYLHIKITTYSTEYRNSCCCAPCSQSPAQPWLLVTSGNSCVLSRAVDPDPNPDSTGSLDSYPDPDSQSWSGSGSRRAKSAKLYKLFRHHWLHIVIWYSYMYQTSANYRSSVADPGCLSRIPDQTFSIPDPNCLHPGSRIPDPH